MKDTKEKLKYEEEKLKDFLRRIAVLLEDEETKDVFEATVKGTLFVDKIKNIYEKVNEIKIENKSILEENKIGLLSVITIGGKIVYFDSFLTKKGIEEISKQLGIK